MHSDLVLVWAVAWVPLVLVHELAHAWMSARCGHVPGRVAVGFGPLLFRWGAVEFRAIPLGGFCETAVFARGSPAHRALVAVAGPLANLLVAALLAICPPPLSHAAWLSAGMGISSLLPWVPMDGGHILLAVLRAVGCSSRVVRLVQDAGLVCVAGLHGAVLGMPLGGQWPQWMAAGGAAFATAGLLWLRARGQEGW